MDKIELETVELWRLLPSFNAVAATGSVSQAAEVMRSSAPTVSKSIRQLEERLRLNRSKPKR
ncbi:MAG: LysR family transcriptional regulator, partial [Myxococcota bacterium]